MNKILEAISASLGEFVNRSFITAGIAPALIVVAGWSLYQQGWGETREAVQRALSSGADFLESMGWWALVIIALAWMFVVVRNVIQSVLANVPFWLVRDLLVGIQHDRHEKRRAELAGWLVRYGALRWKEDGMRFEVIRGDVEPPDVDIDTLGSAEIAVKNILAGRAFSAERRARRLGDHLHPIWLAARWPESAVVPANVLALLGSLQAWTNEEPARQRRLERATAAAARAIDVAHAETNEYPKDAKWLRPTRFGNRLAALDDYAEARYGIDTSTLWIRLWSVLSDNERTEFRHAEQSVSALVNTAFALSILSVGVFVAEIDEWVGIRDSVTRLDLRAVLFMTAFAVLAYAAYRGAVFALGGLKEVVCRCMDIRRLDLLKALGFEQPRTIAQEEALFGELQTFFVQATRRGAWRKLTASK